MFGDSLSRQGIGWASTWTGIEWLIDGGSYSDQWMVFDRYADSNFLKWAEKNVAKNECIIDSGSNIGQFIPYFSKLVPEGRVIAFEPSSALFEWIKACLRRSALTNVEILQKGLGDKKGTMELMLIEYEHSHGIWNSIVPEGGDEQVEITTVSSELLARNIPEVALWKLDVEGYEVPALIGAADLLDSKKIKAAYIELVNENDNPEKIIKLMSKFNYHPYLFDKKGLKRLTNLQDLHKMDALFLP